MMYLGGEIGSLVVMNSRWEAPGREVSRMIPHLLLKRQHMMVPLCVIKKNEEGLEEGECRVLDMSIEIPRGIQMDVSRKRLDK